MHEDVDAHAHAHVDDEVLALMSVTKNRDGASVSQRQTSTAKV